MPVVLPQRSPVLLSSEGSMPGASCARCQSKRVIRERLNLVHAESASPIMRNKRRTANGLADLSSGKKWSQGMISLNRGSAPIHDEGSVFVAGGQSD